MLAERTYFHGVAALSNSLVRNNFIGHIVVGYRGALPPWEGPVQPTRDEALAITETTDIRFVCMEDDDREGWSLGNLKPHFLLRVAAEIHPNFASLWYFDVDIVLKTDWSNFARWSEAGVVLVLDIAETFMPATHLFRRAWSALAAEIGLTTRAVEGYFNSGCIGLRREQFRLLEVWAALIDRHAANGATMQQLVCRQGMPEFAKMDQDLLNAAVMASDVSYAVLGIEAMDAFPSAEIMSHALIFAKPWSRNYIRDALAGFQPDAPHQAFWQYADGPIRPFTARDWTRKRRALRIARLIGHLKRRTVRDW